MADLTLVSFDLCPYVQRAAIALAEKGVPFRRVDIDLADKPDWFLKISPLGKVPVLLADGEPIFESAVIVEYLEETQPNPLHPADPLARARERGWIEVASAILANIWAIETTSDPGLFADKRRALAGQFGRVESALGEGPYFAGARFGLVDCAFAPAFRYFDVFERHLDLGVFDGLAKTQAWRAALAARPSVRGAVVPDYPARLETFLRRQRGVFAEAMKAAA